jgi:hypothetical protein
MTELSRHGTTIFCDDIRFEVGNKVTFVGVYGTDLFVRDFPITLPKLCLAVKLVAPYESAYSQVEIKVFKDDEVIAQGAISNSDDLSAQDREPNSVQFIGATFFLVPLVLDGPCQIKVRAYDQFGDEVRMGAIRISSSKALEDASSASSD